jgi:RHH-type transcriptional regulator, proline utilization regulon repressor / proline dehydrogenase / delta 1-pyrroline-5-carboxylate dehydrogenase
MIVDSSALIEQAVDDIVLSAFGSAGQRCSALRVLYVQEDIADSLITILRGVVENLGIGAPDDFATDMGPVIDEDAYIALGNYINQAKDNYKLLAVGRDIAIKENGYFVMPTVFEIPSIKDLPGEVFGPVVHVVRYKAGSLQEIIQEINSCGYGLTLGIQSRIDSKIQYIRANARIGNIYVNRSMIGATVGVQPFGGEGLSGTGPKAGGPYYLMRFVTERCFTENTAAIGGNRDLLV